MSYPPVSEPELQHLHLRSCQVDLTLRTVHRGADTVALSETEARLLAWLATHPGQVFSRDDLLREVWNYAEGVRSRTVDTTIQRLRQKVEDLPAQPVHILTLRGRGYYFAGGPAGLAGASVPAGMPGNLARSAQHFVGRTSILARIDQRWTRVRCLTLTGAGGIGKSALARHYVQARSDAGELGFWAVDWSDRVDLLGLLQATATAFDVPLGTKATEQEGFRYIGRTLGTRGCRVILVHSPESALEAARVAVGLLMDACPEARVLITSRTPLGLEGESVLVVGPLDPDEGEALFEAHLSPRIDRSPEQRARIGRIVRSLEGSPLAIQLAAARTRLLSLEQIEARLAERLSLLRSVGSDVGERNTSLRASIAWSWALLSPFERSALRQLAVLWTAFDLETAEAIVRPRSMDEDGTVSPTDATPPAVLEVIDRLCSASILRVHPRSRRPFELPRVVRDFAAERAPCPEALQERVQEHYLSMGRGWGLLTETAARQMSEQADQFIAMHTQHYRTAPAISAAAALTIAPYVRQSLPREVALRLLQSADRAASRTGDAALQAGLARQLALAYLGQGRTAEAVSHLERALDIAERAERPLDVAEICLGRCNIARLTKRIREASEWWSRAEKLRVLHQPRAGEDTLAWRQVGLDLHWLAAKQALHVVELAEAERRLRLMLQEVDALGGPWRGLKVLLELGTLCEMSGRYLEAGEYYRQAIQRLERFDDRSGASWARLNYTGLLLNAGRLEEAAELATQVIHTESELGRGVNEAFGHQMLGCIYLERGELSEASPLLLGARDAHRLGSRPRAEADALGDLARLCHASGHLPEALLHLEDAFALLGNEPLGRWQLLVTQVMVRVDLGQLTEAEASLEQLTRDETQLPSRGVACVAMARAFLDYGRMRAATQVGDAATARPHRKALEVAMVVLERSGVAEVSTVARCGVRVLAERLGYSSPG